LLSHSYRSKLDYNQGTLNGGMSFCKSAGKCAKKLEAVVRGGRSQGIGMEKIMKTFGKFRERFEHAMDSDLNTRRALFVMLSAVRECEKNYSSMSASEAEFALREMRRMGRVLGLEWNN
jgi:cysteinyl-tRNA synthetase